MTQKYLLLCFYLSREIDNENKNADEENTTIVASEEEEASSYHAHTIDPNNSESVWSPEKAPTTTVKLNTLDTKYQRVLIGFCCNINRLDDFYFRVQDADQQLKAIYPTQTDSDGSYDLTQLDGEPRVHELCWSRVNGQLYRAEVINSKDDGDVCTVLHVDYGLTTTFDILILYFQTFSFVLKIDFKNLKVRKQVNCLR